jgi:anti-sigma B factor antagonist
MQIRKNITGDEQEFLVSGRIDGDGANQLELEILDAVKTGAKAIYVNLNEATFLCSAGIRVLLQYWRQLKNSGKKLLVTRPSPEVDAALDMTGFKDSILEKV